MTYLESNTLSPAQMLNLKNGSFTVDEDLRRAVTMDELLAGVKEDIHDIFQSVAQ